MLSAWMITGFQSEFSTVSWLMTHAPAAGSTSATKTLKANMKACGIPTDKLESRTVDRNAWWTVCREAIEKFEASRIDQLKEKRRKLHPAALASGDVRCLQPDLWIEDRPGRLQEDASPVMRYVISTSQSMMSV
jgi:hypothetical protein